MQPVSICKLEKKTSAHGPRYRFSLRWENISGRSQFVIEHHIYNGDISEDFIMATVRAILLFELHNTN